MLAAIISLSAWLLLAVGPVHVQTATTKHSTAVLNLCSNNPAGPLLAHPGHTICPPLVDDTTAHWTGNWEPWSFPPMCVRPQNGTGSKLCAYSMSSLRGEMGISLITTPEIAAGYVAALQDPDIAWLEKQRGFASTMQLPRPYEIRKMDGKGFGVVASRKISKDEVLKVGMPILVQSMELTAWDHHDVLKLLHRAANQLPESDQKEMMEMARSAGGYIVEDIMKTNSFAVTINGAWHSALYPEIARINHACKPNAITRYSPRTLMMDVMAYRDIEAGEELSFSYPPLNLLSPERRHLLQGWGFNCTCSLCSNAKAMELSDRQRKRIQEILEILEQPENHKYEVVSSGLEELEDLVQKEGMTAQIGDLYSIIAETYLAMGDEELAREYGELALKWVRHYAGYDNERSETAVRFMERLGWRRRS